MTQEQITTIVINNIRERRIELGLTQQEVAEKIGWPRQVYNRLEAGRINSIKIESIEQIAIALKTTIENLIKNES